MKKIIFILTAILLVFTSVFFGCGENPETPPIEPPPEYFSVTFKQEGLEDIVKSVEKGTSLLDVPTPSAKRRGYDARWDVSDFSNISKDVVVNVVYTPKKYIIRFDCSDYLGIEAPSQTVVFFGKNYQLEGLYLDAGEFLGWKYNGNSIDSEGIWNIDDGNIVTLKPIVEGGFYSVTFLQEAKGDVHKQSTTIYVKEGGELTESDIPDPAPVAGYEVKWDPNALDELQNVTEDLTVKVVYTPKNYVITYELNGGVMDDGLSEKQTVEFGSVAELQTASKEGFVFRGWAYLGKILSSFEYLYACNITLTAVWEAEI